MTEPTTNDVLVAVKQVQASLDAMVELNLDTKTATMPHVFIDNVSLGGICKAMRNIGVDYAKLRSELIGSLDAESFSFFTPLESRVNDNYNPFIKSLDWMRGNGYNVVTAKYTVDDDATREQNTEAYDAARDWMRGEMYFQMVEYVVKGGRHIVLLSTDGDLSFILEKLASKFADLKITIIGSQINQRDIDRRQADGKLVPASETYTSSRLLTVSTNFVELLNIAAFKEREPRVWATDNRPARRIA